MTMRRYIDILNEGLNAKEPEVLDNPIIEETILEEAILEEGVRDTLEKAVDRTLGMFSPNHISYEAACGAYDKVIEITHGKVPLPYSKDDLKIGDKLVKDTGASVIALAMTLPQLIQVGVPITAGIVSTAIGLITANVVSIAKQKRKATQRYADREDEKLTRDREWEETHDGQLHPRHRH